MNAGEISDVAFTGCWKASLQTGHESPCLLAISTAMPYIKNLLDKEIVFFLCDINNENYMK